MDAIKKDSRSSIVAAMQACVDHGDFYTTLRNLVFYQFRQLFYTASPLSEDSWDFFGSFSGRRL